MTRRIPILSPNEDLNSKKIIYKSLIEGVSEAMKDNRDKIRICEIKNQNVYVTVEKKDWKESLDRALEFYIHKEEYEECSKIKNLIDKL
tara:strand:+ start:221 stop:487 length:267 start_codon:yes stop_codon:yes gene_type:complete